MKFQCRLFAIVVFFAMSSYASASILDAPKKEVCTYVNNWVEVLTELNGGGIPVKLSANGVLLGPRPSVYVVAKNLAPHMLDKSFAEYVGKPFDSLTKKEKKYLSKYLMKCAGKNLIYVAVAFTAKKGSRDELAWSKEIEKTREKLAHEELIRSRDGKVGSRKKLNTAHGEGSTLATYKNMSAEWCSEAKCPEDTAKSIAVTVSDGECFYNSKGKVAAVMRRVGKVLGEPNKVWRENNYKVYGFNRSGKLRYSGRWVHGAKLNGSAHDQLFCDPNTIDSLETRKRIAKSISNFADLDYLRLSEEKLGLTFGQYSAFILYVKSVTPGGKADSAGIKKNMSIVRVGSKSNTPRSFKPITTPIFIDGTSGELVLTTMNLEDYVGPNGGVDMRRYDGAFRANKARNIKIIFEGSDPEELKRQEISEKLKYFSDPFFYSADATLVIPQHDDLLYTDIYENIERTYIDSGMCRLPCSMQTYDKSGSLTGEYEIALVHGATQPPDTPADNLDWVVSKKGISDKYSDVKKAFTGTVGLADTPYVDRSYFLAINSEDAFLSNYRVFNNPTLWEDAIVAYAISYAKECKAWTSGDFVEITREYSNEYSTSINTYLVESILYPTIKEFGVSRNDSIGPGKNSIIEAAITELGCDSEYLRNYRRVLMSYINMKSNGVLEYVSVPGALGFDVEVIDRHSYRKIFGLDRPVQRETGNASLVVKEEFVKTAYFEKFHPKLEENADVLRICQNFKTTEQYGSDKVNCSCLAKAAAITHYDPSYSSVLYFLKDKGFRGFLLLPLMTGDFVGTLECFSGGSEYLSSRERFFPERYNINSFLVDSYTFAVDNGVISRKPVPDICKEIWTDYYESLDGVSACQLYEDLRVNKWYPKIFESKYLVADTKLCHNFMINSLSNRINGKCALEKHGFLTPEELSFHQLFTNKTAEPCPSLQIESKELTYYGYGFKSSDNNPSVRNSYGIGSMIYNVVRADRVDCLSEKVAELINMPLRE